MILTPSNTQVWSDFVCHGSTCLGGRFTRLNRRYNCFLCNYDLCGSCADYRLRVALINNDPQGNPVGQTVSRDNAVTTPGGGSDPQHYGRQSSLPTYEEATAEETPN